MAGTEKNKPAFQPTSERERLTSIDTLRGFALLGILVMNIQSFGLIDQKYMNPMAEGPLEGASYWAWYFSYLFFDSKMMAIFSALFGAGIVLMLERANRSGKSFTGLHYRRVFWLLIIGLCHAHLLWHGDILVPYALCAMLVYWLSGLRARTLLLVGFVLLTVGSGLSIMTGMSMEYWPAEQRAEMQQDWNPSPERIATVTEIYRGSWLTQLPHRSKSALTMETFLFLYMWIWRAGGLMLLGMGLYKSNVFQAQRSNRFYTLGALIGFGVGFTLIAIGIQQHHAHGWTLEYSFFFGHQFNYWGSLFVAFAYVCCVMLICKLNVLQGLQNILAAVGQMALTNYLMQTIICTFLFYGHGLGWFGSMDRISLIGIVVCVWLVQMVWSPVWLARFRFGPFEWLWRSMSYWKLQPMRKIAV